MEAQSHWPGTVASFFGLARLRLSTRVGDLQASPAECQYHVSLTTHPALIYTNSGLFLKPSQFMVFSALDHTLPLLSSRG